jgi:hypothetical protein
MRKRPLTTIRAVLNGGSQRSSAAGERRDPAILRILAPASWYGPGEGSYLLAIL